MTDDECRVPANIQMVQLEQGQGGQGALAAQQGAGIMEMGQRLGIGSLAWDHMRLRWVRTNDGRITNIAYSRRVILPLTELHESAPQYSNTKNLDLNQVDLTPLNAYPVSGTS